MNKRTQFVDSWNALFDPEVELEAKKRFLLELYRLVVKAWKPRALNGGLLAEVPSCVLRNEVCEDDARLDLDAIKLLVLRYVSKDENGLPMETPSMVMKRVAEGIGKKVSVGSEVLYEMLIDGRFLFNSPTLFNMYHDGARGTLSACYVTPVGDSLIDIMEAAKVQALTFKWGGGQGFSFSELRPRNDVVKGTSGVASGPTSFAKLFDAVTEVVKQGSRRRGANMGILHVWHPDIYNPRFDPWAALYNSLPPQVRRLLNELNRVVNEVEKRGFVVDPDLKEWLRRLVESGERNPEITIDEAGFVQAKEYPLQDANLTNFNISVAINDAFMEAVVEDREWWFINPRFSEEDGVYRLHYTVSRATNESAPGVVVAQEMQRENPYVNVFEDVASRALEKALNELEKRRSIVSSIDVERRNPLAWRMSARKLFEKIVEIAWLSGDPGAIYIDNHNKWHPTPWLGMTNATNPCGEQVLYPFESCNLGSLNLEKYVRCNDSECYFDLDSFARDVAIAVEALDTVIDLNKHPDERQQRVNVFTRKIGLGYMGLANALARLGIPYDSDEGVAFTLIVTAAMESFAWVKSWELGAEKGAAPAFMCRRFDWRSLTCREYIDPRKCVDLHVPGLRKASLVATFRDGWLVLTYHRTNLDRWVYLKLRGLAKERVMSTGSVKLVPIESIEKISRKVFGFDERILEEALEMSPSKLIESPRHLVALAIYRPGKAWSSIVSYGESLGAKAPRNTVTTSIAPTGSISIIAGTSNGIEPFYALIFERRTSVGTFVQIVKPFRDALHSLAKRIGIDAEVLHRICEAVVRNGGSLRKALLELTTEQSQSVPPDLVEELRRISKIFPTALEIDVWWHLAHQAAAQLYIDQSISKTINLPRNAPREDVYTAFLAGWLLGLKGVTVFREGSKASSVLLIEEARYLE